jgi:hypothetical protein
MRNWSHGLMFAAVLSLIIVVSLLFASCAKGGGFELDIDLPKKVSVPKKSSTTKVPSTTTTTGKKK